MCVVSLETDRCLTLAQPDAAGIVESSVKRLRGLGPFTHCVVWGRRKRWGGVAMGRSCKGGESRELPLQGTRAWPSMLEIRLFVPTAPPLPSQYVGGFVTSTEQATRDNWRHRVLVFLFQRPTCYRCAGVFVPLSQICTLGSVGIRPALATATRPSGLAATKRVSR